MKIYMRLRALLRSIRIGLTHNSRGIRIGLTHNSRGIRIGLTHKSRIRKGKIAELINININE